MECAFCSQGRTRFLADLADGYEHESRVAEWNAARRYAAGSSVKTTDGSSLHGSHGKHKTFFSFVTNLINGIILKPKFEEHLQDKIIDLKKHRTYGWLWLAGRSTTRAVWKPGSDTWPARWPSRKSRSAQR